VSPRSLAERRLYLCTPDRLDLESFVDACIRGGVDVVQLREKHLDDDVLVTRAAVACEVCHSHGVPFIVNDRPDLAVAAGADGVHVGQTDASPDEARAIVGADAIVGLSTHRPAELDAAATAPVDYLSAGPVVPTPTKPGRPGTGLEYLSYAASQATVPWFVTGGAAPDTVPAMVDAGATRFVVVRWLTESGDARRSARELRDAIDRALAR
jgi:thiamine-phosphate pyrophosphorylase